MKHGYPRLVLVCGGRDFDDQDLLNRTLNAEEPGAIIQGGAKGADLLASIWAHTKGVPCFECKANWTFYKKKAGMLRNEWMVTFMRPDLVVAFPTPTSIGTWGMLKLAEKFGIPSLTIKEW